MVQAPRSKIGRLAVGVVNAAKELVGEGKPSPGYITKPIDFALSKKLASYDDVALVRIEGRQALARTAVNAVIATFFDNSTTRLIFRPALTKLGIDTLPNTDPFRLTGALTKTGMIAPIAEAVLGQCPTAIGLPGFNLPIEKVMGARQFFFHDVERIVRGVKGELAYRKGEVKTLGEIRDAAEALGININLLPNQD